MTSCPRGVRVGVEGVETAAACLRVRTLDIFPYQDVCQCPEASGILSRVGDEGVYLERRDLLTEDSRYLRSSTRHDRIDKGFRNRIRARETYLSKQTKEGDEVGFVKGRPYRKGGKSAAPKFGSIGPSRMRNRDRG
jgi:hypothetical protein